MLQRGRSRSTHDLRQSCRRSARLARDPYPWPLLTSLIRVRDCALCPCPRFLPFDSLRPVRVPGDADGHDAASRCLNS